MLNWEVRKARKEYKCSNCKSTINKGDLYEYLCWAEGLNDFNIRHHCNKCGTSVTAEQYKKDLALRKYRRG